MARAHVTRIQSRSLDKEEMTEANHICPMKNETSVAGEGNTVQTWIHRERRDGDGLGREGRNRGRK